MTHPTARHTPWTAKSDPFNVGEFWISDAEGTTVASGFLSKERAELCALAPEMLEALEHWLHESHLQSEGDRERFRSAARALISKARGAM